MVGVENEKGIYSSGAHSSHCNYDIDSINGSSYLYWNYR